MNGQEVRLDSVFPHEFKPEDGGEVDAAPSRPALETTGGRPGSQMHHLLDALQHQLSASTEAEAEAEAGACRDVLCKYQLVYQPAMSMHDRCGVACSLSTAAILPSHELSPPLSITLSAATARNRPFERNEEGVAMLVRATDTPHRPTSDQASERKELREGDKYRLEVSRVQPLFLPRDMDNKMYTFCLPHVCFAFWLMHS